MKTLFKSSISFVVVFVTVSFCYAGFFEKGTYLVQGWRAHQKIMQNQGGQIDYVLASGFVAYIKGVFDATENVYAFQAGVTVDQVIAIVGKYLDAHPEAWSEKGSDLVIKALNQAFNGTNK